MKILDMLYELQDESYADFQSSLVPGIPRETFIGVRIPNLRRLAKKLEKEAEKFERKAEKFEREAKKQDEAEADLSKPTKSLLEDFLHTLPHTFYEENILHAILLSNIKNKNYELCLHEVEEFLPFINNWAVCDTLSPKIFKMHKEELLPKIREWALSSHPYTIRFGLEMLMKFYLDDGFKTEYLEIPANVQSEEYYVNMMKAWFFAEALAKQWDVALPFLEKGILDKWTHNKAIQKARESYRISGEHKEYLKSLKR